MSMKKFSLSNIDWGMVSDTLRGVANLIDEVRDDDSE